MKRNCLALAALLAATAAAEAGTLAPYEAGTIALGSVGGIAYYVERPDGFHVVATVADLREVAGIVGDSG